MSTPILYALFKALELTFSNIGENTKFVNVTLASNNSETAKFSG
jgi:hypothetical protein